MKSSLSNSVSLLSSSVFAKVTGLLLMAFIARSVTKEELAVIPVYIMLGELVVAGLSMGVFPILVRNLPALLKNEPLKAKALFKTGAYVLLTGALILISLIFFYATQLSDLVFNASDRHEIIQIMCIAFVALIIRRINESLLSCSTKFKQLSFLQYIEAVIRGLGMLVFVLIYGGYAIIYALVINEVIIAFIAFCFNYKFIFLLDSDRDTYSFSILLKKSLPFYLETYLMYFRTQGDNWIITTLLGPAALAMYYIAKIIFATLFMLYQSVDKVFTQKIAQFKHDKLFISDSIPRIMNIVLCTAVPFIIITMLLSPSIVYVVAGEEYENAALPAMILCLVVLIYFIRMPIGRALFVLAPPSTRLRITLLETLFLMPALVVMAKQYGAPGVAISLVLSMIVGGIYTYILLKKYILFEYSVTVLAKFMLIVMLPSLLMIYLQYLYLDLLIVPLYVIASIFIVYLPLRFYSKLHFRETLKSILPVKYYEIIRVFI